MTSLAELRAIEHERVASERAAVVAEAEARMRATADAEARAVADAEAKIVAAREQEIRIAREREQAERAARMHVEAAEATERARHAAALEQERMAQEIDLRRQEVAKKRPTWMVAVTIGAVLAAGALTWFGIDRYNASQAALTAKDAADKEAEAAKREAEQAKTDLEKMDADLKDLDARVGTAIDRIVTANDAAARDAAKKEFERLKKEAADLRVAEAKRQADLAAAIRRRGFQVSEECKKNALAKGCQ